MKHVLCWYINVNIQPKKSGAITIRMLLYKILSKINVDNFYVSCETLILITSNHLT